MRVSSRVARTIKARMLRTANPSAAFLTARFLAAAFLGAGVSSTWGGGAAWPRGATRLGAGMLYSFVDFETKLGDPKVQYTSYGRETGKNVVGEPAILGSMPQDNAALERAT